MNKISVPKGTQFENIASRPQSGTAIPIVGGRRQTLIVDGGIHLTVDEFDDRPDWLVTYPNVVTVVVRREANQTTVARVERVT